MDINNKIKILRSISDCDNYLDDFVYDKICQCDLIKYNYRAYMITQPINCDIELTRLHNANYDLCCALLTMLFREDHFCDSIATLPNRHGDIKRVIYRLIAVLETFETNHISSFSEKALTALNGYYVYALIAPRSNDVFYIGKGIGNRVFSHEVESVKSLDSEKEKLRKIKDIESSGFSVKRIIVNWGLTEDEAFASEASLINLISIISENPLTNIVAGHHVHGALSVESFEREYGAEVLKTEDIKHNILVIKINKLYRKNMSEYEIYDTVRGMWRISLNSIKTRNIRYVFAVYNSLIVGVYKPDEWHYVHENIDLPQSGKIDDKTFETLKDRAYFICNNYDELDEDAKFYLHKSIAELKLNQSAQNPISYLMSNAL